MSTVAIDRPKKRVDEKLKIQVERADAADQLPAFVLRPVKLTKKLRKKNARK